MIIAPKGVNHKVAGQELKWLESQVAARNDGHGSRSR